MPNLNTLQNLGIVVLALTIPYDSVHYSFPQIGWLQVSWLYHFPLITGLVGTGKNLETSVQTGLTFLKITLKNSIQVKMVA